MKSSDSGSSSAHEVRRVASYRSDVDGLRFIAVVSVVLYHAGPRVIPGGFVGVDIFFVISGYLITGIIYAELEDGRFSIVKFYERRVMRIFPALAAMTLATSVAAWFIYMPFDFHEYCASLTNMAIFCSNIYFYTKTAGYFDETAALKPLLHTWSLAIEEQYYVFFPPFLMIMHKVNRNAIPIGVLLLGILSLVLSIYEVGHNPTAAFYIIWYRAWELFAGSLISLRIIPTPQSKWVVEIFSAFGLALILYPIFFYTPTVPFPGEGALPPVFGTALIIYAGEGRTSLTSRFLSFRPFVFIGLVSYSFYLWHWPILVFPRYAQGGHLAQWESLLLTLVAFGVSVLSWRFVERPFRRASRTSKWRFNINPRLAFGTGCIAVGLCFGAAAHRPLGLPWRFSPQVSRTALVAFDINPHRVSCDSRLPERIDHDDVCSIGDPASPESFAVIGDSFGDALSPGVDAMAKTDMQSGYVITEGGCVPLLGTNQSKVTCRAFLNAAFAFINRHPNVKTVILIGRWTTVANGSRFGADNISGMFVSDDETTTLDYEENRKVLERGLKRDLAALSSRRVFIMAFLPEQAVNVPRTMGLNQLFGTVRDVSVSRSEFDQRQDYVRSLLNRLHASYNFTIIDAGVWLCNKNECPAANTDGTPFYLDDEHLSDHAAINLKMMFAPAFEEQLPLSESKTSQNEKNNL